MFKSNNGMSRALVRRETIAGYLFLLPSLFFFVTFVLYPMFMCIYTSLFDSNMGKNAVDVFVGLDNYKELFRDELFLGALKNTVVIVVVAVPTVCAFSLWVATAIYDMKPALTSAFRCIFYLPVVTGSVAVTVVWKWMYNNRYGVFNYLLKSTGIIDQNINWLGDARFALWCIITHPLHHLCRPADRALRLGARQCRPYARRGSPSRRREPPSGILEESSGRRSCPPRSTYSSSQR